MSHPPFSLFPSWLSWAWIPWNRRVGTGAKSVILAQSLWQQIAAFAVSSLIMRALTSVARKHWKHQGCCWDFINNILNSLELVESSKAAKFSWEYLELLCDGAQSYWKSLADTTCPVWKYKESVWDLWCGHDGLSLVIPAASLQEQPSQSKVILLLDCVGYAVPKLHQETSGSWHQSSHWYLGLWVPVIAEGENQSKDIAATAMTLILIFFSILIFLLKVHPCGAAGYLLGTRAPERKFLPSAHRWSTYTLKHEVWLPL